MYVLPPYTDKEDNEIETFIMPTSGKKGLFPSQILTFEAPQSGKNGSLTLFPDSKSFTK